MNFVVYSHTRLDRNEVFYIGIGQPDRPYHKRRNQIWNRVVSKTEYKVDILFEGLTWEQAVEKEVELIKFYGRKNKGEGPLVNLTDGGEGNHGYVWKEESKKQISDSLKEYFKENENPFKGKTHSEETRVKLSEHAKNREMNPDAIEAMRNKNIGRVYSPEHRAKLSDAAMKRPPMSQEVKDKISKSITEVQTGKPCKEETKRKISQSLMGHKSFRTGPTSEETKRKISDAQKGKKLSEEHRLKLSVAAKNRKRGPLSEETKRKIGEANRKKPITNE